MNEMIGKIRQSIIEYFSKTGSDVLSILCLSDYDLIVFALNNKWLPKPECVQAVLKILNGEGSDDNTDDRIRKCTWKDFGDTGLLWLVNVILNVFGWAIVNDKKSGELCPARVTYRGFTDNINSIGYEMIASYLKDMSEELYEEIQNKE